MSATSFAALLAMRRREREAAATELQAASCRRCGASGLLRSGPEDELCPACQGAGSLQPSTEAADLVEPFSAPHTCHAEGCSVHVPPAMFACKRHWGMVPKDLQRELWRVYLPGQEQGLAPVTDEYVLVQTACRLAIAQREGLDTARLLEQLSRMAEGHPTLPEVLRRYARPAPAVLPPAAAETSESFRQTPAASVQVLDLDARLIDCPIAVLDTETTGLPPGARVVEIAVVTLADLHAEPVKAWRSLCDPEMEIPWQASKVHGIRDWQVQGQPTIAELWPALQQHTQGALLCAHNARFDEQILREEAALVGVPSLPGLSQWLDTLAIARRLGIAGGKGTGTLEALCAKYEIEPGKHSAGSDAYATALLLQILLDAVWVSGQLSEGCTVREFLRWQSGAPSPRPRGQPSLLDLPPGSLTADQADELVRRGDQARTSTEQSRSYRLRRSSLAPVVPDLPRGALAALWRIEDGTLDLPTAVPDLDGPSTVRWRTRGDQRVRRTTYHQQIAVTWGLLDGALWRALVQRVGLHLESGAELCELRLPGWSWEEIREAAQESRQRRAA